MRERCDNKTTGLQDDKTTGSPFCNRVLQSCDPVVLPKRSTIAITMLPALIIIAQNGYQDTELEGTRKGLLGAGFDIVLASTAAGECHGKFGGVEQATIALKDIKIEDYDRVAFIGGPGAHALADDPQALRIARETAVSGNILGAICIAPVILAKAGVLSGKHATVFDTDGKQASLLEESGAHYTGEPVTVDGQIVTANGPEAAMEFGRVLAGL